MKHPLYMVTGAPGSGKSTAIEAFIELQSDYIAFDIDWLAEAASDLANKNIFTEPSTWKPYGVLWFEFLLGVYRNGKTPVFFTPTDPQDIEQHGQPAWCSGVRWLLLDCDDQTRRERLTQRPGWTETMIAEALIDAHILRQAVDLQLDTAVLSPYKIAVRLLDWLEQF